jgi:UDPglucose 6-dehydrogenase
MDSRRTYEAQSSARRRNQDVRPSKSVGVIGVGVLGSVVSSYFEAKGHDVKVYDKFKALGSLDAVNAAEVVFICVPTPYLDERGFDVSAVEDSIQALDGAKTIVIRSTVPPGTTVSLQDRFPRHRLFFNPEFLREKTAQQDFLRPDRQIVGYCGDQQAEAARLLAMLPRAPYEKTVPTTVAELIKMGTNAFLALKVIFGNQIYDVADALAVDYDDVRAGIAADPRIGASHLDVFDSGYRGYGGKCLPKDTLGLIDLAESLGTPVDLLRAASAINEELVQQRAPLRRVA